MAGKSKTTQQGLTPEHLRSGALSLAIWDNEGERGAYKTFTLQRSYRDAKGEWHNTTTLRLSDLLRAAEMMRKAYDKYGTTE